MPCPAKSLQSCLTLCDPRGCSTPGSSVHGILQARILEWVAVPSSRGSSWPRDWTLVSWRSCIVGGFFTTEPLGNPQFITLDPKHRSLRKCYSLSQIKNTVGHCPAPTSSLPHTHTHQKEDSQLLALLSWLCDSAQSPLWFCSPSPGRTAEIHLSIIEKADVISRSWHYLGKKQVVPCVSVFRKDWRMVRSRLA